MNINNSGMKTVKFKFTQMRLATLLNLMKEIHCPSIQDPHAALMANGILTKLFKRLRNRVESMNSSQTITVSLSDEEAAALQVGLYTVPTGTLGIYEENVLRSVTGDISSKVLFL